MSNTQRGGLLIIAYKFPPMHSTSCVRTWGIYQHMRPYFDEVVAISTSNRHILRQEPVDLGDAKIFDAQTLDYRTLLQRDQKEQSAFSEETKRSFFSQLGQKVIFSFPMLRYFGEGGFKYIRSASRIGSELIGKYNITHVMSTFSPYADHLIAYQLKKKHPHLFWIADFRDLHVDPTLDNLVFRKYQLNRNRQILSKANIVTTVSDGLAVHLQELHECVEVFQNGIAEMPDSGRSSGPLAKFRITYTGSMFGDLRRPDLLFEVLAKMLAEDEYQGSIELIYAGKDSGVWRQKAEMYNLASIVEDRGLIGRADALELQSKSHINLLLTYSSPELKGNLTGKIYEYLASGRPTLVLVNGPRDNEIEQLVQQYGGLVAYNGEHDKVYQWVAGIFKKWKAGESVHVESPDSLRAEYSWESRVRRLMERIEKRESIKTEK